MDNGISFIDSDLKHIVVSADTQEEFIQMLGRKRANNEKVTLYIYRRNQSLLFKIQNRGSIYNDERKEVFHYTT